MKPSRFLPVETLENALRLLPCDTCDSHQLYDTREPHLRCLTCDRCYSCGRGNLHVCSQCHYHTSLFKEENTTRWAAQRRRRQEKLARAELLKLVSWIRPHTAPTSR